MSGMTGSAARLVARAVRPAVGRRGGSDLVEEIVTSSPQAPVPVMEPPVRVTRSAQLPGTGTFDTPPLDGAAPELATPAASTPARREVVRLSSLQAAPRRQARSADGAPTSSTQHGLPFEAPGPPAEAPVLVTPVEPARAPGPALAFASPPARPEPALPLPAAREAMAAAAAPRGARAAADRPIPAGAPRAANPPPVVIDRIEIVTPPARPPALDPLASLAARRAGLSRHRAPH